MKRGVLIGLAGAFALGVVLLAAAVPAVGASKALMLVSGIGIGGLLARFWSPSAHRHDFGASRG